MDGLILGINAKADGHDPAAAVIREGQLVCAAEEERFLRLRHAPGASPYTAIAWALCEAGVEIQDVETVAFGWDPRLQVDAPEPSDQQALLEWLLPARLYGPVHADLLTVPHHLAHAAGAFYSSGFPSAAALVVDGSGEDSSVSAFRCTGSGIEPLWSLPYAHSLGFFYEALTRFVGFGKYDEGKTMGLAAYGVGRFEIPSPVLAPPVAPVTDPSADHYFDIVRGWVKVLECATGVPRNAVPASFAECDGRFRYRPDLASVYADVARSGQDCLERDMVYLGEMARRDSSESNLVLSGGVAFNCVANRVLSDSGQLYVQPAAGDSGVALGAALYAAATGGQALKLDSTHVYAGRRFSRGMVADSLRSWQVKFADVADREATVVAQLLAEGRVVARFAGAAEFGPRALGNRSLLIDPSVTGASTRMNAIKGREVWRPLALSVPRAECERVFGRLIDAPFMLVAHNVEERERQRLAAGVHVDGSSRPQVVNPDVNPEFHTILEEFGRLSGVPGVVNTSFNVGEPMVDSPRDAVRTLFSSGIDAMVIEGLLVEKNL